LPQFLLFLPSSPPSVPPSLSLFDGVQGYYARENLLK
jgi:hypothetical protein